MLIFRQSVQLCYALILGLATVFTCQVNASPLMLHVSPEGSDQADGRTAEVIDGHGPFRTIKCARDAIRSLKSAGVMPKEGVIVNLAPGQYRLSEALMLNQEDSGTGDGPILYRGAGKNTTIISGDTPLQQPLAMPDAVLSIFPEFSRSHILCFDLNNIGPDILPGFASGGAGFRTTQEYSLQLAQNGERLPLAHWPNENHEYAMTGTCLGPPTGEGSHRRYESGVFEFKDERLKRWANEPDLWLYGKWCWHWADQRMRVKAIDLTAQTITIDRPETHAYGFHEDRPFKAINAISELDSPGEWAIDRRRRKLYVWPQKDIKQYPLQLAVSENLLLIRGASDIRFEGLQFQATRGDAILVDDSQRIVFARSVIRQTGTWAMRIKGGSDCTVIGCDMDDLGEGGVSASGGDLKTLTPANHRVENCYIHHFGKNIATYRPAVRLDGVGCVARNNLIHNTDHAAILYDGNDHLIEYNIIHDALLHTSDAGAIYASARNWAKRGNVVQYNLIHSLGQKLGDSGCRGIYLDDHTSGTLVQGNIVTMASQGLYIGGGKDNLVTNNLFLQCDTSMALGRRNLDSKLNGDVSKSNEWKATLSFPIDTPLWQQRYPDIRKWMQGDPNTAYKALGNSFINNIAAGCGAILIDEKEYVINSTALQNNVQIDGDPGLVDAGKLDFQFTSDAQVLKDVPGFEKLPVEKMGLYPSAERVSPARRFGPEVKPLPPFTTIEQMRASLPQYPVQLVKRGHIKVDGKMGEPEWNISSNQPMTCAVSLGGNSKLATQAYFAVDDWRLYLAVQIDIDPGKPLIMDGKWGARDGFEFAFRDPTQKTNKTFLVQCFPDGTFQCLEGENISANHVDMIRRNMTCVAKVEKNRWTCEVSLRMKTYGLPIDQLRQLFFNLNIRRMCDNSWMAWVPNVGGFRHVDQAGMLIFPEQTVSED